MPAFAGMTSRAMTTHRRPQFCSLTPSITTVDAELDPGEFESSDSGAPCP